MLAELRKYTVGTVLAHQYLDQIEPDVRHAVLGNAGTLLAFRVGGKDAPYLEREFVDIRRGEFPEEPATSKTLSLRRPCRSENPFNSQIFKLRIDSLKKYVGNANKFSTLAAKKRPLKC